MAEPEKPAVDDFVIVRGNDQEIVREYYAGSDPVDLTGSVIVFRAMSGGEEVLKKSSATPGEIDIDDPTSGRFVINIGRAESRDVPLGRLTHYEIERRIDGKEKTFLMGFIAGIGGDNDDG